MNGNDEMMPQSSAIELEEAAPRSVRRLSPRVSVVS